MVHIAVERECGSGGTQIAEKLAEKCGVPCYGTEILEKVADVLNMSVEQVRSNEEKVTGSLLWSLYMLSQTASAESQILTDSGKIFVEEQRIIKNAAEQGSAVFLGHCAGEALKDSMDVIRVFIHADTDSKHRRIHEEYNIPENMAESFEKKNNRRRASYYYANTQKKWNDYCNYDIVLDSTRLGIDGCVNVLEGLFRNGTGRI